MSKIIRRKRGFSVTEMLVVAAISLVVLAVIFQLLVPSLSLFKGQMAFSQAHQSGLLASQKIKRELANTGLSTITLASDSRSFCFAPREESAPFDGSGRPQFQERFIVYFVNDEAKLIRKFWPFGSDIPPTDLFDGPAAAQLTQDLLVSAISTTNGSERVLATGLTHFLVTDDGTDNALLEPPVVVELTCSIPTNSEKVEQFEVRLEVAPRSIEW